MDRQVGAAKITVRDGRHMIVSSATSGEHSAFCHVCGKVSMVVPCWPLADATCTHCGSLVYVKYLEGPIGRSTPAQPRRRDPSVLLPGDAEAQRVEPSQSKRTQRDE